MRTTLDIDDDVLQAAKELARRGKRTAGHVLSALTRRALTPVPCRELLPARRAGVLGQVVDRVNQALGIGRGQFR